MSYLKQYLPKADKLYLTQIQADIDGDTFFPEINWAEWHIEFENTAQMRIIPMIVVFNFAA